MDFLLRELGLVAITLATFIFLQGLHEKRKPHRRISWNFGQVRRIPAGIAQQLPALNWARKFCEHKTKGHFAMEITLKNGYMLGPIMIKTTDLAGNETTNNGVSYGTSSNSAVLADISGVQDVEDGTYIVANGPVGDSVVTATVDPTEAPDDNPILASLMVHVISGDAVAAEFNIGSLTPIKIPAGL